MRDMSDGTPSASHVLVGTLPCTSRIGVAAAAAAAASSPPSSEFSPRSDCV